MFDRLIGTAVNFHKIKGCIFNSFQIKCKAKQNFFKTFPSSREIEVGNLLFEV